MVFAGLIGVGDDAGDAMVLIIFGKDGGEVFYDFHFGDTFGIFGEIVVKGGVFKVEIVGGGFCDGGFCGGGGGEGGDDGGHEGGDSDNNYNDKLFHMF